MLTLRGDPDREDTQRIRGVLEDLSLQFDDRTGAGGGPPILADFDFRDEGAAACERRLEELEQTKAEWDRFQSDACYIGDDGDVF